MAAARRNISFTDGRPEGYLSQAKPEPPKGRKLLRTLGPAVLVSGATGTALGLMKHRS